MGTLKVFLSCAAAVVCVLLFVDQQGKDSTYEDQREVRWLTSLNHLLPTQWQLLKVYRLI